MGNGSSSRRNNGRIQHNPMGPYGPPRMTAPQPPGYPPSLPPNSGPPMYMPNHPFYYMQNYNQGPIGPYPSYNMPSNGQFMMNYQQQFRNPPALPSNPSSVAESQKAITIRNDVNVLKATLRLEKDDSNPGFYLVAFSFDANVPGCFSIFFFAQEKENCAFVPMKPNINGVTRVPFRKGYTQTFQQASGSGLNLLMFDERDLTGEGKNNVFTVVVRAETLGKNPPPGFSLNDPLPIADNLPKYVHCQATQAVLEKKDNGEYKVKVVNQIIWVDGCRYVLQEIYGIENAGGPADFDENDSGKECVICLSEPRDTTVLPCRHMCMCRECAKVLNFQNNRCPICRTPVERLLEIEVPRIEDITDQGGSNHYASSAGQSSATHSGIGQSSGGPGENAVPPVPPDSGTRSSLALVQHDESVK